MEDEEKRQQEDKKLVRKSFLNGMLFGALTVSLILVTAFSVAWIAAPTPGAAALAAAEAPALPAVWLTAWKVCTVAPEVSAVCKAAP